MLAAPTRPARARGRASLPVMVMPTPLLPDPDAWAALEGGAVMVRRPDVGALRVRGADAIAFLHGQLAHDVRGLPEGGARRSLLLNVKGHALAEMSVHRRASDVHLAVDDGAVGDVADRLRAHVVFDAVEIVELGEALTTVTVQGPDTDAALERLGWDPPSDERFASVPFGEASLLIVRHARSAPGGVDVHLLAAQLTELQAALRSAGVVAGDDAGLTASRVAAGLPSALGEAGARVLPQEAGLDALLSTRKGCYLGQEVMARIEARGRLKRELALLALRATDVGEGSRTTSAHATTHEAATTSEAATADEADRTVLRDGRTVGRVGTVARHPVLGTIALAVLRSDVPVGATLSAGGRVAERIPIASSEASPRA